MGYVNLAVLTVLYVAQITIKGYHVQGFEINYSKKAVKAVQEWSDAHPQRTYLSEFLKNYPNAPLDDYGTPKGVCPHTLGLMNIDDCDDNCIKCWNQPIEGGEK